MELKSLGWRELSFSCFGIGAIDNLQSFKYVLALVVEAIGNIHKPAATMGQAIGHNRF